MKSNILIIILLAVICISASVVSSNLMTIKPAQPKQIFTDYYVSNASLRKHIVQYHSQGYVIKTLVSHGSEYLLVMEKY